MASIHKITSRYQTTPIKDFYLDIWVAQRIETSADDGLIEIEAKYHERPDLLSFDLYGSPRWWWVFACRNIDILIDPIGDFKSGTLIFTPTKESIDRISNV